MCYRAFLPSFSPFWWCKGYIYRCTYITDSGGRVTQDDHSRTIMIVDQRPNVWACSRQGPLCNDVFSRVRVSLKTKRKYGRRKSKWFSRWKVHLSAKRIYSSVLGKFFTIHLNFRAIQIVLWKISPFCKEWIFNHSSSCIVENGQEMD